MEKQKNDSKAKKVKLEYPYFPYQIHFPHYHDNTPSHPI